MTALLTILLVIAVVVVINFVLRTTDAAMRPFDDAFREWEKRTVSAMAERNPDAVGWSVPLQVVGGGLALVLLILLVTGTTSVALFIFYLAALVGAGFIFDLGRQLGQVAGGSAFRPPPPRTPPAPAGGHPPAKAPRPAQPTPAPSTGPVTYTASPPTPEDVRRRVRIAELRKAADLTPGAQSELDLLLSIDARRGAPSDT